MNIIIYAANNIDYKGNLQNVSEYITYTIFQHINECLSVMLYGKYLGRDQITTILNPKVQDMYTSENKILYLWHLIKNTSTIKSIKINNIDYLEIKINQSKHVNNKEKIQEQRNRILLEYQNRFNHFIKISKDLLSAHNDYCGTNRNIEKEIKKINIINDNINDLLLNQGDNFHLKANREFNKLVDNYNQKLVYLKKNISIDLKSKLDKIYYEYRILIVNSSKIEFYLKKIYENQQLQIQQLPRQIQYQYEDDISSNASTNCDYFIFNNNEEKIEMKTLMYKYYNMRNKEKLILLQQQNPVQNIHYITFENL